MPFYDIIGYLGAALLIIGFFTRHILQYRWFNFLGWLIIFIYAIILVSFPLLILSIISAIFNLYYIIWVKLGKGEKFFRVLYDVKLYGKYTQDFIKFHRKQIEKLFPDIDLDSLQDEEEKENINAGFVFRDITPIGLFVYKMVANNTAEVVIDFTEPKYTNLLEACFLTHGKDYLKDKKGIKKLVTYTSVPAQVKHLEMQGFKRDENENFRYILDL